MKGSFDLASLHTTCHGEEERGTEKNEAELQLTDTVACVAYFVGVEEFFGEGCNSDGTREQTQCTDSC